MTAFLHPSVQRLFLAIEEAFPYLTSEQKYAIAVGMELSAKGQRVRFDTSIPTGSLDLRPSRCEATE